MRNSLQTTAQWCMLLFFIATFLIPSCHIDKDLEECPYNVRLEYWYTGTGQANVLPNYIYRVNEFLFDSTGVLRQINQQGSKKSLAAELKLPPGRYTLVTWGNADSCTRVSEAEIGRTRLSDILLYADNPVSAGTRVEVSGRQRNGSALYYGYISFTVPSLGVLRQRIDMVHAHLKLDVLVKWKGKAPTDQGDLYMSLSDVPSVYRFMPAFEVKGSPYSTYGTAADGSPTRSGVWYYIPESPPDYPLISVEVPVKMDITRTLSATFLTHRIRSDDHPVLRLYGGGQLLLREIDLYKYFRTMQIDLDENLRQEFSLVIEIDASGGILVFSATVSDWVDGGAIGGLM